MSHLPSELNQFIGRYNDMESAIEEIKNDQLVIITGSPGIGKTCFAIRIANHLLKNDPSLIIQFIDLRCIDSVETIVATVLQYFSQIPQDKPVEYLCNFLNSLERKVVLVFDNCEDGLTEKLKTPFMDLMKQILLNCTSVKLLCTSRVKFFLLNVNCKVHVLHPLEVEEALSLLRSNVPHVSSEHARKLVYLCGCAPLALRIIANLINDCSFCPVRLIEEIDPNSSNPMAGYYLENLPENFQLEAVINSSYVRLPFELQRALCTLSIFPSTFEIQAAEFVVDSSDINRTLAALRLRSLLSYDPDVARYSVHPCIRAFAKCKNCQITSQSMVKFVSHYASILKLLSELYYSRDFQVAIEKIRLEKPNIIKMLISITEGNDIYESCRVLADKFVVRFIYMFIPVDHYVFFYTELLRIAKKREDQATCSRAYFCLGYHYRYIVEYHTAIDMLENALSACSSQNPLAKIDIALLHSYLAWCHGILKDPVNVLNYIKQVKEFVDQSDNQTYSSLSMAFLLNVMAKSYAALGNLKNALKFSRQALNSYDRLLGDHLDTARELYHLSAYLFNMEMYEEALPYSVRSRNIHIAVIGKSKETANILKLSAIICFKLQDFRKALSLFRLAENFYQTIYGQKGKQLRRRRQWMQDIENRVKICERKIFCHLQE